MKMGQFKVFCVLGNKLKLIVNYRNLIVELGSELGNSVTPQNSPTFNVDWRATPQLFVGCHGNIYRLMKDVERFIIRTKANWNRLKNGKIRNSRRNNYANHFFVS